MNITWHGQTCFRIITQKSKNGSVNILIDPPDKESGLNSPKNEADILLVSNENKPCSFCTPKDGSTFSITGPGEYDIKDVYIHGFSSGSNTIYTIEAEDIKICHLGLFNDKEISPEHLEKISGSDILMLPIGGGDSIDAKDAVKIMSQIEPKIILPMYYKIPKLKTKVDGLDSFLHALGIKKLPAIPKLVIKKKDISKEEAKIIVLEP